MFNSIIQRHKRVDSSGTIPQHLMSGRNKKKIYMQTWNVNVGVRCITLASRCLISGCNNASVKSAKNLYRLHYTEWVIM